MASSFGPRTLEQRNHRKRSRGRRKNEECQGLLDFFAGMAAGGGVDLEHREWRVLARVESMPTIFWDTLPSQCIPVTGEGGMGWAPLAATSSVTSLDLHDAGIAKRKAVIVGRVPKQTKMALKIKLRKDKKRARRKLRKFREVESFYCVLSPLLQVMREELAAKEALLSSSSTAPRPLYVVDFASGSGALVLPLAGTLPLTQFLAVDMNPVSCRLLEQRVQEAGLTNVTVVCSMIETFESIARSHPIDVVLGLHACGNATDFIIEQALSLNAAYIVSPCCIGKISEAVEQPSSDLLSSSSTASAAEATTTEVTTTLERHPRSAWLSDSLTAHFESQKKVGEAGHAEGPVELPLTEKAAVDGGDRGKAGRSGVPPPEMTPDLLFKSIVRLADISEVEFGDGVTASNTDELGGISESPTAAPSWGGESSAAGSANERTDLTPVVYPMRRFAAHLCKCVVELDRNRRATEASGCAALQLKLLDHKTDPQSKSDLLVGIPSTVSLAELEKRLHTEPMAAGPALSVSVPEPDVDVASKSPRNE